MRARIAVPLLLSALLLRAGACAFSDELVGDEVRSRAEAERREQAEEAAAARHRAATRNAPPEDAEPGLSRPPVKLWSL